VSIFVDTSALHAVLDRADENHEAAAAQWRRIVGTDVNLVTTSYTLLEATALAQKRLGIAAVRSLQGDILPWLTVEWIGEDVHHTAMAALLSASRRSVSLVDCVSFEIMRRRGVEEAFTFDSDFRQQGFRVLP